MCGEVELLGVISEVRSVLLGGEEVRGAGGVTIV